MNSESPESIDVLLATNMISVGIDVDRLGLMVVAGQTKGASEYIQATGRIGRRENVPGIVFTLYNPYKPRDLSHYEDFTGVHLTLQRSVEPVGLTPFSDRAMERAMHAILIGLIRLTIPRLSRNSDADMFRLGMSEINEIQNAILERFRSVQNIDEHDEEFQKLRTRLSQFLDNWNLEIQDAHRLHSVVHYLDDSEFDRFGSVAKKTRVLMADFATKESSGSGFPKPTPGSLRDVETEAKMFYEG
jgi:superfamily II DNA or RNA helicase